MTRAPASGTLGMVQLMVFANAASGDAAREVARELAFTQLSVQTGTVVEAAAHLAMHPSPEILLIEIGDADTAPAQLDALADMVNPLTKVIATGTTDSVRFYQWLSDLGIDGYLLQPFTAAELKTAIAKGSIKKAETAASEASKHPAQLICLIGARGGVGTTTLSVNLAALYAGEFALPTALIDIDAHFGCEALALDLMPGRGLRDALEKPDRVDALFLERVMMKPRPNLSVLSAEEPLNETISMQANAGEMILGALREKFRVIVVDMPRQMNLMTRHLLSEADHLLIVAEPHITSMRDCLRIKDLAVEQWKCSSVQVILNRIGLVKAHELSIKDFHKSYGGESALQLPYVPEVVGATALGELLANTGKTAALYSSLKEYAQQLLALEGASEPEATSTSMLARMLRKG
jgi:pilus assembly protein CpaE